MTPNDELPMKGRAYALVGVLIILAAVLITEALTHWSTAGALDLP